MKFSNWLDTFIQEKGIDRDTIFEVEISEEFHLVEFNFLVDFLNRLDYTVKQSIKNAIVYIDFKNGNVMNYFKDLAEEYVLLTIAVRQ